MKIYLISGLAADRRIFSRLELPHHFEVIYLDWLPVTPNETLTQYALRLGQQINVDKPFVLIGLSFGGVVAIEISKVLQPAKLILISSASSSAEIPVLYRMVGKLKLESLVPKRILTVVSPLLYWFFGPLSVDSKQLISEYIRNADHSLLVWSIGQITRWKYTRRLPNLVQIHGSADRVFPVAISKADFVVAGGHLCVFDNSAEVSKILTKILS